MKTTVAISKSCRIEVNPCSWPGQKDHVVFHIMERTTNLCCSNLDCPSFGAGWELVRAFLLKPDQVGALIFALEMAAQGSPETLNDKG